MASKDFLSKLASSGINISQARQLGIVEIPSARALGPSFEDRPAAVLKYFSADDELTPFFRVRYLGEGPVKGFAVEKQRRYAQPPNTSVHAYFPRCKGLDWGIVLADEGVPLLITEGELKAACATLRTKRPAIGLGGVWSWRSSKKGVSFIPELDGVKWSGGRHVFLVFDSDAANNPQVMQALWSLARELTDRGAHPHIVNLPNLPGLEKTGLDDFLVERGETGEDDLDALLAEAEPFRAAQELWDMNAEICYVRDPGTFVELRTGRHMSLFQFTKEAYATRKYTERVETKAGPKLDVKYTATEWVKWPHRFELECVTYRPGQAPVTPKGELNGWRPGDVEPVPGNCALWESFLDHLFEDAEPEVREWFVRWAAYPLQHPGAKLLTAAVMWGVEQGTGKTLMGHCLARMYGQRNISEVGQDALHGAFNEWLVNKQLIIADEIVGSDRRVDGDRLKALITSPNVRVNAKFQREYTVPCCANFFFTSNHPDAVFIEDTDRRYFVHEIRAEQKPPAFYRRIADWMKSPQGASALLAWFLAVDLGDFDPSGPALTTTAKRDMLEDSKSDLGSWVLNLRRQPVEMLRDLGMPDGVELLTANQLLALFKGNDLNRSRVTSNGLSREMKRQLYKRLPPIGIPGHTQEKFWVLQRPEWWTRKPPRIAAAHWLKHFGGDAGMAMSKVMQAEAGEDDTK